jgi:glycosyltransferase involved in cell wall biosynthesis
VRILHVIPSISPVRGGTSRAILDMVHALREQQIDVEIATTNDDGDDLLDVPLGRRTLYDRIPTYFFPRYSPPLPAVREFAVSGALTIWLFQNIPKYDAIHVHALFSYTSTVAMAIARLRNIPYANTPHGLLCEWSLAQGQQKKQVYLQLIERKNLDRAGAIHLTCQPEQQDFHSLNFKSPTFIIPLALTEIPAQIPTAGRLLRENLKLPLDEPIILFMSRLHRKKGLDYLIPALGKLRDRRFTFIIAGNGTAEYEAEINSLLLTAGIGDRTHLAGFVEGDAKNLLIQGADLFALTSYSENFGIAVLEALSVGLPVLLTPGVGISSMVKEHQLGYVTELDITAISQTISQHLDCLSDPTSARESSLRIRQFVRDNCTRNKIAQDLIDVYQNIIN